MNILDKLLADLSTGWRVISVDVGNKWVLSQVQHTDGRWQMGVAAAPREFNRGTKYPTGTYQPDSDSQDIIPYLRSNDASSAAVALATFNATQSLLPSDLTTVDAADWLSKQCKGRKIAIFGRFPFIQDEIRPFAEQTFVFEQSPQADEYSAKDMPVILPQADLIAITGTTIMNHTIDGILSYVSDHQTIVVLGPSTPLSTHLFEFGIDVLFGVRVADVKAVQASVRNHLGFQKVQGLQRVSLFKI